MKWLAFLLQLFPAVLQSVVAVESTVGSLPGASKKELVLASVSTAAKIGQTVDESHVKAVSTLIDDVVASLNKTGVFASKLK